MKTDDFDCIITEVNGGGLEVDMDNGQKGFIPRKEISWSSPRHPALIWKVGTRIRARYIGITNSSGRLILSKKQLTDDPWISARTRYSIGQIVEGHIEAIFSDDSVFIEIEEGVSGRISIYELGLDQRINPYDVLGIGDIIRAEITGINEERNHFHCNNRIHLERVKIKKFRDLDFENESFLISPNDETVVKILGHVYPLRALCKAAVVWSRLSARDSRIMSRAIRPSKQTLLRTRYTLFCIFR